MTNIIEVEGVKYRKVKRKAEAGEKVLVFGHLDEANGVFSVDKVEYDGHIHYGVYGRLPGGYFVLEPAEPSPSVTGLLANLALRVSELERHNREQAYEINELYKAVSK